MPYQVAIGIIALALGITGYVLDDGGRPIDDLYRSFALFAGATETIGHEHVLVTIARWLALLVTVSAVLDLPEGLPGRARLELATEQVRTALVAHVHAAAARHGIPLPADVPPDLLE